MEIVIGRNGTQCRPIKDPTVSRKHCTVTDNGDGTYVIENLSPSGTKVDGIDIVRTTVNLNSRIQLGHRFCSTLAELIGVPMNETVTQKVPDTYSFAKSNISQTSQPQITSFDISHLRQIWENYNNANIRLADSQRKTNLIRTGLGIFTMCAMPTIFFLGPVGYILTGIGIIGNIYSFAGMKNSESAEARQRRQDAFDDSWICPNPECGRSILAKNYRLLVRNYQSCPYCKCKYVEK